MRSIQRLLIVQFIFLIPSPVFAQGDREGDAVETQKKQLQALSFMDGTWRGSAWIILPTGQREEMTQTERIGPMLDGAVKVVEGRGYDESGKTVFNAFAVIAYDAQKKQLVMRSYAEGRMGDFPIGPRDDGYSWEISAGPAKIRYTATIKDGKFVEYGERIVGDRPPVRFFEMNQKRLSDSDWPAAGAVKPK
jgi:hypothetical protein